MSFENYLNETCTIARPTKNGVDRYNANTYSDSNVASDVRCRLIEKSVKVMGAKSSEYTWVKAKVLLLPAGTDVKPKDEVTINSVVYRITQPLARKRGNAEHHVSCVVEAINA